MSNALGRPALRRRGFGAALTALVAAFALPAAGTAHAQSDPVAEFYKGKTVTILVGYEGGGGYDIYARIVAQFLGKHIPGNPAVIVQNMPGAGGLRAARNLATVSAKDGTALGMLAQTLPFDTLLGYTPDIDAGTLHLDRPRRDERRGRRRDREDRGHVDRGRAQARGADRRHRRHRELDGGAVPAQPARRHPLQADRRLQERQRGAGHHGARRG